LRGLLLDAAHPHDDPVAARCTGQVERLHECLRQRIGGPQLVEGVDEHDLGLEHEERAEDLGRMGDATRERTMKFDRTGHVDPRQRNLVVRRHGQARAVSEQRHCRSHQDRCAEPVVHADHAEFAAPLHECAVGGPGDRAGAGGVSGDRVVVEDHLGVGGDELAVGRLDHGVDFDQFGVFADQGLHQLPRDVFELLPEVLFEPERALEALDLEAGHADQWIDVEARDLRAGHVLDLHAARGTCHHGHPAPIAVDERSEIELAFDLQHRLDIHGVHGLVAETAILQQRRLAVKLIAGACRENAAALAAPARQHLRLDHPAARARLGQLRPQPARRNGNAMACQQGLAFVLEKFHAVVSSARLAGATHCPLNGPAFRFSANACALSLKSSVRCSLSGVVCR
jgi:hypothetical protein